MNIIIAFVLVFGYAATFVAIYRTVPRSLSQTVFSLPHGWRWIWTAVIVAVAFLTMPRLMEEASEPTQFLGFLACGSLLIVGVCPLVQQEGEISYIIHMVMAYTCAVASQLLVLMNDPTLLLGWMPWLIVFAIQRYGNKKWNAQAFWAEIVCFVVIFLYGF